MTVVSPKRSPEQFGHPWNRGLDMPTVDAGQHTRRLFSQRRVAICLSAIIVIASLLDNTVIHYLDSDMSWLLIVADRMIAGDRLYVDVWEVNPPFSVFLYFPSAWLANVTGLKAEMLVGLSAYLWTAACLAFTAMIARRIGLFDQPRSIWLVPVTLALVLLSLPQTFGQREFFGVLAALPMLVVAAGRDERRRFAPSTLIVAGALASVTMMVKPHYALAFLFPYLYLAFRQRSVRLLFAPDVITAGVLVIGYAIATLILFPEFLRDVVPVVRDVYAWRQWSFGFLLLNSPALHGLVFFGVYVFLLTRLRFEGPHAVFALSFAGFYAAFLLMGKGFPYHALPFFVTGGIAVALAAIAYCKTETAGIAMKTALAVLVSLVVAAAVKTFERNPTATETIRNLARIYQNPSVAVIASNISIGSPFTRTVGGRWLGSYCSDWLGAYALERLSWGPDDATDRLRQYLAIALAQKHEEIVGGQPDIIVVDHFDGRWIELVLRDNAIKQELKNYETIGQEGTVEYLRRNVESR